MCDYHSIVVRRDGAKAHVACNSHSTAVKTAGWRENDQMADMRDAFFVESEWEGLGKFPGAEKITRGPINEKQRKTIETHYTNLAKLMAAPAQHGERMLLDGGYFAGPEYADIRWKIYTHPDCPKKLVGQLAATVLFSDGAPIKSLHPVITKLDGNLTVEKGITLKCNLAEVSGDVSLDQGATLTAPALVKAGDVRLYQGATLT